MENFEYKEYFCYYIQHPKLSGNYYIADLGMFYTRAECRKAINKHIRESK